MSHVEKKMNKEDLEAWKVYDNHQYALIPGISHKKHITQGSNTPVRGSGSETDPLMKRRPVDESVKKNFDRMAKYGL